MRETMGDILTAVTIVLAVPVLIVLAQLAITLIY